MRKDSSIEKGLRPIYEEIERRKGDFGKRTTTSWPAWEIDGVDGTSTFSKTLVGAEAEAL